MSANRKHIIFPNSDAGKAEEIAFITHLAEDVQPGTYLADLFTKNFVSWIVEQIRNDFTPDLYGALEHQHELNSQAELRCAAAIHEIDKSAKEHRYEAEALKKIISDRNVLVEDLKNRIEFLEDQNVGFAELRIALVSDCNESKRELAQAVADLAAANQKVLELKARMFDLMVLDK